ncbi:MAG TPA: hypothetical protein VM222_01380 [Planctomycetota bacterium]|nr:hypothetical protein [Planctomycetota bacterium]
MLALNGSCPLPDGVILTISLNHAVESLANGVLEETVSGARSGTSEIVSKKFAYGAPIEGPGKFLVQVGVPIELQEMQHAAEVKKRTAKRTAWQFEYMVWDDELVPQLSPKLLEFQTLVAEVRAEVKKFELACETEQGWLSQAKALTLEGNKLRARLEGHELKAFYPAAVNNLFYTMRNVLTNTAYYTFTNGKFSGATDYHAENKKVSTFRKEDFNWENLKRYVEESLPCAGREFSLWIVKDLRRTAGQMRPEILEAIKLQKAAPGVDVYSERLQKATISDLDALEADIRGKKAPGAPKEGEMKK